MIEIRPFSNNDSPGIAAVWSKQPPLRGRLPKLTTALLEQHILSKPYFDPRGLIVAIESGRVIGFVHVGFNPCEQPGALDRHRGIISMLMVASRSDADAIAADLLNAGEILLRDLGAIELLGGGYGVHAPFYLGLYGGCRLPGVLSDDVSMIRALQTAGYVAFREVTVWQRELATFRPPVDREMMALRRQYRLQALIEESLKNWNDVCAYGWIDPFQFGIDAIANRTRSATLTFWSMEPLASGWGQRAMGLANVAIHDTAPMGALLTCFIGEALRQFQTEGVALQEIQTEVGEAAVTDVCQKLGFKAVDRGVQFRKLAGVLG